MSIVCLHLGHCTCGSMLCVRLRRTTNPLRTKIVRSTRQDDHETPPPSFCKINDIPLEIFNFRG